MMWPFRKKPEPKSPPLDRRNWNDDWKIGDTAEVVADASDWDSSWKPWHILPKGGRFTVVGFDDGTGTRSDGVVVRHYWLKLGGLDVIYPTIAFRKVRPVAQEESEVAKRILKAPKVGPDRVREDA